MLRLLVITLMITSCAYKPVVDHRGNKGTEVAYRYNDDLQTCYSRIINLIKAEVLKGSKDYDEKFIRNHVEKLTS